MIAIGSNGSVAVSRLTNSSVEEVCCHNVGPGMVSPIIVAVVSEHGHSDAPRRNYERTSDNTCGGPTPKHHSR